VVDLGIIKVILNMKTLKYCEVCGKKLLTRKVERGFDGSTGKKIMKTELFCPEYNKVEEESKDYEKWWDEAHDNVERQSKWNELWNGKMGINYDTFDYLRFVQDYNIEVINKHTKLIK
jgi:hypothetical protein